MFKKWVYLNLDSNSWFCIFVLKRQVFGTLGHLSLTLSTLDSLCKNKPPNIRMIDEEKKRQVKIHLEDSPLFVKYMCMAWNVLDVCAVRS